MVIRHQNSRWAKANRTDCTCQEPFSPLSKLFRNVPSDSAALGSVVNAHVSYINHQRRLRLAGVSERVATLLKVTNVDRVFAIYPTVSEAIASA